MRSLFPIVAALCLAACGGQNDETAQAAAPAAEFDPSSTELAVEARPAGDAAVELTITTNLPTPVRVSADATLQGLSDDDPYVGIDEFVTLTGPKTVVVLDGSESEMPLPAAKYDVEVKFHQAWGADDGNPAAAKAPDTTARTTVDLKGNGATQASVDERARKTKLYNWAALNLESGMPWDRKTFEAKLGPSTKGPSSLSRNHDAYFFADPDITLLVNRVTNEMTVWRKGDVAN